MYIKKISVLVITLCACFQLSAQDRFKVMFYNLLNYPSQSAVKINDLEVILDDARPDLFLVCELNNSAGSAAITQKLQTINTSYQAATFVTNTSDDNNGNQNDLQNMLYYNSDKFILSSETIVPTILRDFNVYKLLLNTPDQGSNPIYVHVVVGHLKAANGSENRQKRLDMVQDLTAYLNTLPVDAKIILGGDLNIYTDQEPAFQELVDNTNHITFIDPANRIGNWHYDSSYHDVYTQSTRTQTGLGGATGGFDDRFDFILTSENLQNNSDVQIIPNSYKVFGNNNNSNCYNGAINSNDCNGVYFDASIRQSLYNMSDHLPVVVEFQTGARLSTDAFSITTPQISFIDGNLVNAQLKLNIPSQLGVKYIDIHNTMGQFINRINVTNTPNISVNISNYATGIYYISTNNPASKTLKFVKVN